MVFKKQTYRYCIVCKNNNVFFYNSIIGHSECSNCGSRYSKEAKEELEIKKNVFKLLARRKERLKKLADEDIDLARIKELNVITNMLKNYFESIQEESDDDK